MATYFVATNGNDSTGTGSQLNPYLTFGKVDSVVAPGDTAYIRGGSYPQSSTLITTANGTVGSRILWKSYDGAGVAKLPSTINNNDLWRVSGNYCDVVGFDVSGTLAKTGFALYGHHERVWYCSVHDCGTSLPSQPTGAGFFDYTGVTTIGTNEFGWCKATNCGPMGNGAAQYHCYYLSTNNDFIHDCLASNGSGYGILLSGVNNAEVSQNTSHFNGYAGFALSGSAGFADFNVFKNNISYNNTVPASGVNGNGFIRANSPGGTNNVWTNNCAFLNNVDYAIVSSPSETITGVNAVHADPLFANYQSNGYGDYRLKLGSPCIDAGIASSALYDVNGVSRPQNAIFDMGAYEYVPIIANQRGGLSLIGA